MISCSFLSSKLDSPVMKILESECLSNVLITGESNFDEKNGQLINLIIKEIISLKIRTLDENLEKKSV